MAAVAAALAACLVPAPPGAVERYYSAGIYPAIQRYTTLLSNRVPFAVGDALVVTALLVLSVAAIRSLRRAPPGLHGRALLDWMLQAAATAAFVYLAFLALWGLNYERVPLAEKLDYDAARASAAAAEPWTERTVERLNSEVLVARGRAEPDAAVVQASLLQACGPVFRAAGGASGITPGRPKRSLIDSYLGASGIEGLTNPFGLEVILNSELLPVERPFILAHEWAHLAGFADESEAGFLGWLACTRANEPAVRYSGWLALYQVLPDGARRRTPVRPEVVADLAAISARARRRYRPVIGEAQERVYDRFLKAHRVEEGIASYGLMLRLVLGTRFGDDGLPLPRP
jgi:hypothetical protein